MFSCGKSTEHCKQYKVKKNGEATETVVNQGLMGWLFDINLAATVEARTLNFS